MEARAWGLTCRHLHVSLVVSGDIYQWHLSLVVVATLSWENSIILLSPSSPLSLNPSNRLSVHPASQPFKCPLRLRMSVPADELSNERWRNRTCCERWRWKDARSQWTCGCISMCLQHAQQRAHRITTYPNCKQRSPSSRLLKGLSSLSQQFWHLMDCSI